MLVEHPKFNGRRTESGRTLHYNDGRLIAIQSLFYVCFIDRLIIFIREHIFYTKVTNDHKHKKNRFIAAQVLLRLITFYSVTGAECNGLENPFWWVGLCLLEQIPVVWVPLLYDIHMAHGRPVPFHTRYSIGTEWLTESNCPLCAIKTHLIHIKVQSSHHHRQTDRLAVSIQRVSCWRVPWQVRQYGQQAVDTWINIWLGHCTPPAQEFLIQVPKNKFSTGID